MELICLNELVPVDHILKKIVVCVMYRPALGVKDFLS